MATRTQVTISAIAQAYLDPVERNPGLPMALVWISISMYDLCCRCRSLRGFYTR